MSIPLDGRTRATGPGSRVAVAVVGVGAVALGVTALDVGTVALLGDLVPPERTAAVVGLRASAGGIGGILGPAAVGVLGAVVGLPAAFAAATVPAVLVRARVPDARGDGRPIRACGASRPPRACRDRPVSCGATRDGRGTATGDGGSGPVRRRAV